MENSEPAQAPETNSESRRIKSGFTLANMLITVLLGLTVLLALTAVILLSVGLRETASPNYETAFAAVRSQVVEVYGNGTKGNAKGSGVIYKIENGKTYVISNFHVTGSDGAPFVRFTEYGEKQEGKLLGYDSFHDIALIEIDGAYGKAVTQGSSYTEGTPVLAAGNSLAYGIAAFDGIVSRTSRMLKTENEESSGVKRVPVIAVTCPINAGMSGGGLFSLDGKIVGINTYRTQYVADGDTDRPVEGMSYCVPFSIADKLARRILDERGGGQTSTISVRGDPDIEDAINFDGLCFRARFTAAGLTVTDVLPSSADMSGDIMSGDIVTKIGSLAVSVNTSFGAVFNECLKYVHDASASGETLKIVLDRNGQSVTVKYDYKRSKY